MRETRWSCDRCGEAIVAGRTTIEVVTGPERLRRPEIDLCSQCTAVLWSWLDTPPPSAEASPGRDGPDGDGIERTAGRRRRPSADG